MNCSFVCCALYATNMRRCRSPQRDGHDLFNATHVEDTRSEELAAKTQARRERGSLGIASPWLNPDRVSDTQLNGILVNVRCWWDNCPDVFGKADPLQDRYHNVFPRTATSKIVCARTLRKPGHEVATASEAHCVLNSTQRAYGGTGEPFESLDFRMGQRARSTYHTSHLPAEGKEPKSTDLDRETKDVAYLRVKENSVVRSNGTKQGASQTSEASALTCTEKLHNLRSQNEEFRASGLFSLMKDINLWIAAYKKLAPNPGSHEGGAGGTIDGTSMKSLEGNPRPKEKALASLQARSQEVMRTILETVCEPRFLKCSNSGEPGYSQHTCMKQIRRYFRGAVWYIEGRRSKCFDTIDHQILMSLLHKKIQDDRFLTLVRRHLYKIKRPLIRSVALSKDDHIGRHCLRPSSIQCGTS
jgi:hypothetical protein